jgi:hypothetical protein
MNFILDYCVIGLFTSSSLVSGVCVFDKEPIPVSAVRGKNGVQSIASNNEEFFDRVLDFSKERCELVITYSGKVKSEDTESDLLGTEYVCKKDKTYIVLESGGPHLFAKVSRLQ